MNKVKKLFNGFTKIVPNMSYAQVINIITWRIYYAVIFLIILNLAQVCLQLFPEVKTHQKQLDSIIIELKHLLKDDHDSWDWLVKEVENVEMCKTPIVISCKTRGLVDEDE